MTITVERPKPSLTPTLGDAAACKLIKQVGGLNPFKKPMYRMVVAETVGQLEGGEWHDYPEDAEIHERGGLTSNVTESGLIVMGEDPHKPERVVCEMRVVERYPDLEGWILERWRPPSEFGSREQWEAPKLKGHPDMPILGPFPSEGGYDICCQWQEELGGDLLLNQPQFKNGILFSKTLKAVPGGRALERAILQCEDAIVNRNELGATPEQRIKARLDQWLANEAERRRQRKEEKKKMIEDHMRPYWGSSPEAGRLREALARRAKVTSHVGN